VNWSASEMAEAPAEVATDVDRAIAGGVNRGDLRVRDDRHRTRVVAPNCTKVAPVNPLPVTITVVPPPTLPLFGLIAVTTGAAVAVLARSATLITSSFFCEPEGLPTPQSSRLRSRHPL
jgi:hypothetical protein